MEAKKVWRRLTAELIEMGLVARCDGEAYARYCRMVVRWRAADVALQKHGETQEVLSKDGHVSSISPRPEVKIVKDLAGLLLRLEAEMGLTPAARERLAADVGQQKEPEGKGRFFAGKIAG